jgi:hypothetical protein
MEELPNAHIEVSLLRDIHRAIVSHSKCLSERIIDIDGDPRGAAMMKLTTQRGGYFWYPITYKFYNFLNHWFGYVTYWQESSDVTSGYSSAEDAFRDYKDAMANILNRILVSHGLQTYLLLLIEFQDSVIKV